MAGEHILVLLLTLLLRSCLASLQHAPSVTVSAGSITGTQCPNAPDAVAFRGIPYAKPPVSHLRFAPPMPCTGTFDNAHLDATHNPPSCVQFGEPLREPGPESEDCLYLNIWTPRNASPASALPVRVWLYGGANTNGGVSDPLYDGCNVAALGAIMVSVNYRLGALGFMTLRGAGLNGNQALKDQILALRWVQDNIRDFGGDASKVMLHGQSAGAQDAYALATLPEAPRLFSSAIFESGAGSETTTCANAQRIGEAYAQALNCSADSASCLRSTPIKDLVTAFENLPIFYEGYGHFPGLDYSSIRTIDTGPSVDGDLIKVQPTEAGLRVPSIVGYASHDGALFVASSPAFSSPLNITSADYTAFLKQTFGSVGAAAVEKHLPFAAFANDSRTASAPGFAAISYVYTAAEYTCPTHRALKGGVRNGMPMYAYAFNHTPSCPWEPGLTEKGLRLLGATHTSEIPFVLGNVEHLPPPNGTCSLSEQEKALSEFMLEAWTQMAATQRPAPEGIWPRFEGKGNATMGVTFNDAPDAGMLDFSICELFDALAANEVKEVGNQGGSGCTAQGIAGSEMQKANAAMSVGRDSVWNAVNLLLAFGALAVQ